MILAILSITKIKKYTKFVKKLKVWLLFTGILTSINNSIQSVTVINSHKRISY